MKHLSCLIAGALLTCGGMGIAEAGPHCETLEGKLTLAPLPNCNKFRQIKRVERIFEDAVFLYDYYDYDPPPSPPLCFEGTIAASLTGPDGPPRPVTATSLSALTANAFTLGPEVQPGPPKVFLLQSRLAELFTAASVVTISSAEPGKKAKELGSIFLRDMGVSFLTESGPYSYEQLIGVGGTREFARASVSLQIQGNEFDPVNGANVSGIVCR